MSEGRKTLSYLPSGQMLKEVISLNAEGIQNDALLLAVHEKMNFVRTEGDSNVTMVDETDLLQKVVQNPYPYIVKGPSGGGKSHAIRWIELNLRSDPKLKQWHIVRIPKAANVRTTLRLILQGLEGTAFDVIRKEIANVKQEELDPERLAGRLASMISESLDDMYKEFSGAQEEKVGDFYFTTTTVREHCKKNRLPALFRSIDFLRPLISADPEGKLYAIADQMINGVLDEVGDEGRYRIEDDDLGLDDIERFGDEAYSYIEAFGLDSDDYERRNALQLLDAAMPAAQKKLISGFFGSGETFAGVMRKIREALQKEGKTLCILVEDMSLIRAIEDDLVEQILIENKEDKTVCDIHSVLAVTSRYEGFLRHISSIVNRAGYQYEINGFDRNNTNEEFVYKRIENFCAKYLNAARWGTAKLDAAKDLIIAGKHEFWESKEENEKSLAEIFGRNSEGISLYPFNREAIKYISRIDFEREGRLEFNPRTILRKLLLEPLVLSGVADSKKMFPLGEFKSRYEVSTGLLDELGQLDREEIRGGATAFANVWSGGAVSLKEVRRSIEPEMAEHFCFPNFAEMLKGFSTVSPQVPVPRVDVVQPSPETEKKNTGSSVIESEDNWIVSCANTIDELLENPIFNQTYAKDIRQHLNSEIDRLIANYSLQDVRLINKNVTNQDKERKHIPFPIEIPKNKNNPKGAYLEFCTLDQLKNDDSIKRFLLAFERRRKNPKKDNSWNYPRGLSDQRAYENFMNRWTDYAIPLILANVRAKYGKEAVERQLQSLAKVSPRKFLDGRPVEVLNALLEKFAPQDSDSLSLNGFSTGLERVDSQITKNVVFWENWSENRSNIIKYYGDRHPYSISGDAIVEIIERTRQKVQPASVESIFRLSHQEYREKYKNIDNYFVDFDGTDEFRSAMKKMNAVIHKASENGQYNNMSINSERFRMIISRTEDVDDEKILQLINLSRPYSYSGSADLLLRFPRDSANAIEDVLSRWDEFIRNNKSVIDENNERSQGDQRQKSVKGLSELFQKLKGLIDEWQ